MGKRGRSSLEPGSAVKILASFVIIIAVIIGVGLGFSLAETANIKNQEHFEEHLLALPTKILDINGNFVTEFSADEKRELVSLSELPQHLIQAVLAREDVNFYHHKGFSIRGITRAVIGQVIGKEWGGGSTISQQVAGTLYTDRTERTVRRKVKELWWAIQIERRYTKNEILEIYLNYMYMGPGTYGVEASSKYFFGKSSRDISLAEAALLVIQLSSPKKYNPLDHPNVAMGRQRAVLDRMVELGFAAREEAEASFSEYWDNYDYTRASTAAFYHREDKAPWFSEYVRRELDRMMYGTMDYYRDGYTVHTTLDLRHQEAADKFMAQGIKDANDRFNRSKRSSNTQAERTYIPVVDMLTLLFDLSDIHSTSTAQNEQKSISRYTRTINPIIDMAALALGIDDLKVITNTGFANLKSNTEQNVVEGALISIENQTGYITAIVGGSRFEESNQLIRAIQGVIQPGSAFKPLYYSAAIDTKKITAGTMIYDSPIVFYNDDGTPHVPLNFRGEWKGPVLVYDALSHSMNVPSIKVLDIIGFDAAISRASLLLDVTDANQIRRLFPRVYPLGLGISSTSPLRIARAYAIFGNEGRDVTPIAIRLIEDRNGRVVFDTEREIRLQQRRSGNSQVISAQNAYIMSKILEKTVEEGSLASGAKSGAKFAFKDENGKTFRIPVAGKTGTTQNWADAWAVGYSPYYTTAIWFGFDKPGNSLGTEITGSTLSGHVWGDYMREIHQGLSAREFVRPASGIIDVEVCRKSGLLITASCNEGKVTLPFLTGTQPSQACNIHSANSYSTTMAYDSMRGATLGLDDSFLYNSLSLPTLPEEYMSGPEPNQNRRNARNTERRSTNRNANTNTRSQSNYLLDGYDLFNDNYDSFYWQMPEPEVRNEPPEITGQEAASPVPGIAAPQEFSHPEYLAGAAAGSVAENAEPGSAAVLAEEEEKNGKLPAKEESGSDLEIPEYNPLLD